MTMKISLFDINHPNTMAGENKAKSNVITEQVTIPNNTVVDIAGQPPKKLV